MFADKIPVSEAARDKDVSDPVYLDVVVNVMSNISDMRQQPSLSQILIAELICKHRTSILSVSFNSNEVSENVITAP